MTKPSIHILILNWNRELLLRSTVFSIFSRTAHPFKVSIIDNCSTDGSQQWLKLLKSENPDIEVIFNHENKGGEAFNQVLDSIRTDYVFFCENDLEFRTGWDTNMITAFEKFPKLGQLSPFSPTPMFEIGEKWVIKRAKKLTNSGYDIHIAESNVGTTCMIRSSLLKHNLRWKNISSENGEFKFPDDGNFSKSISDLGYLVAWSDSYQLYNWGHNERILSFYSNYFMKNIQEKANYRIDGMNHATLIDTDKIQSIDEAIRDINRLQNENISLAQRLSTVQTQLETNLDSLNEDFTQLYWAVSPESFKESASLRKDYNNGHFDFEVKSKLPFQYIRFDPLNQPVELFLTQLEIKDPSGNLLEFHIEGATGHYTARKSYLFYTDDPFFIIKLSQPSTFISFQATIQIDEHGSSMWKKALRNQLENVQNISRQQPENSLKNTVKFKLAKIFKIK